MMFEEAARLRDRIKSINQIQKYHSVYIRDMRNIDIFAIKILGGKSCVYGMFYRNGTANLVKRSNWRDKNFGIITDLYLGSTIGIFLGFFL